MATKVKAQPKRKTTTPKPRAASRRDTAVPALGMNHIAPRRRKLVRWASDEVFADQDGNAVTWGEDDPEAEVALMAKARASGGGWALVPEVYKFQSLGASGRLWR